MCRPPRRGRRRRWPQAARGVTAGMSGELVDPLIREAELNHRVRLDRDGRQFLPVADSRWGELILPAPDESPADGRRRIAGRALRQLRVRIPGDRSHEGLCPPISRTRPARRLGDRRSDEPRGAHQPEEAGMATHRSARRSSPSRRRSSNRRSLPAAPSSPGRSRPTAFATLLDDWQPDAIVSCVFGQIIDRRDHRSAAVRHLQLPPYDLAHGIGAGPTPAEDLAARGLTSTAWTIHHLTEAVDAGGVVAVSPSINVADAGGKVPADPLVLYDKLLVPVGCLVACLLDALWHRFARAARVSSITWTSRPPCRSRSSNSSMRRSAPTRTRPSCRPSTRRCSKRSETTIGHAVIRRIEPD